MSDSGGTGSRVSKGLFFGFGFSGLAVSFLFIVFRLSVRWRLFKKLFWDDALVIFSWFLYLAVAVAIWATREGLYIFWYLASGTKPVTQYNIDLAVVQIRVGLASVALFLASLWLIKLSFLIFFRRLGGAHRSLQSWWWIVTAVTVVTFCGLIGAIPYECTTSNIEKFIAKCGGSRGALYRRAYFYCHLVADILTDGLIISIPVFMLWNVRMPTKQKLGLIALFSMTILVMLCAIIRIAVNSQEYGAQKDSVWGEFWAMIELTIAIIVACCGSFRQLFKKSSVSNTSDMESNKLSPKMTPPYTRLNNSQKFESKDTSDRSPKHQTVLSHHELDAEEMMGTALKQISVINEVEVKMASEPISPLVPAHLGSRPSTLRPQSHIAYQTRGYEQ